STPPPVIPDTGSYIGGILLSGQTSPVDFNNSTGIKHSLFMTFVNFPDVVDAKNSEYIKIKNFVNDCKAVNATPVITVMTNNGLSSYTKDQIIDFANILSGFDVPVFLRWNHEMNGSWYIWSQEPTLYIEKFREFATEIHTRASNVAMVWTPNQGAGYPWSDGVYYNSSPSSADFILLDTNKDGIWDYLDDPYSPYYPGDLYVDWVGHSYYHWSNGAVRGINEVPTTGQWGAANGITGTIPNFHDVYAVGHNKPMMIAETSALYDSSDAKGGGASEADIKKEWIKQVYNLNDDSNPKISESLPRVKAILWFSQLKYEQEVSVDIDWRLDSNQQVINYYNQTVSDPYFIKAD
ncbi:MAG: glycosyl hydrolase, partial [bacterium]